jgi:hypothetical protein
MIVSHKHRLIFMKSQKTAGTSLELALSGICGEDDIITPLHERHERERNEIGGLGPRNTDVPIRRHRLEDWNLIRQGRGRRAFWEHVNAREVRAWLPPAVWRNYYKFAVERNPWDRAISLYWWLLHDQKDRPPMLEFFQTIPQRSISNLGWYAIDGEVVLDHVMRYENLVGEIASLCARIGLNAPIELPHAKSGVRKDRRPYQEVLGPKERDVIAERCSREIDLLGYEF